MVELAVAFMLFDFEVGERSFATRAPVDEIAATIDQSLVVKADKYLAHRPRQAGVHGKALAGPVARHPQGLELVDDMAAGLIPPDPHSLDELFLTELPAVCALLL